MKIKRIDRKKPDLIVGPLTTTEWGQERPYNEVFDNPNIAMGCAGVAGGQVMKYYNHPPFATGTLPEYFTTELQPEMDIDGYEYRWDLMPDVLTDDSSQEQKNATSNFLYHAGYAAQTTFNAGSPGNEEFLAEAMVNNFGYDKNLTKIVLYKQEEQGYTIQEVSKLLREELDLGRVIMTAIPGHAVVCDGYADDDYFSFNYGWDGEWHEQKLDSSDIEARRLYIGIQPAKNETLLISHLDIGSLEGFPGNSTRLKAQVSTSGKDFAGYYRVVLLDSAGVRRSFLTLPQELSLLAGNNAQIELQIDIPVDATYGKRRIALTYSEDGKDYRPLRNDADQIIAYDITIKKYISDKLIINRNTTIPEEAFLNRPVDVNFEITSSISASKNIGCYIVGKYYNSIYKLGSGTYNIDASGLNKCTMTLDFSNVDPYNDYFLAFVEDDADDADFSTSKLLPTNDGTIFIQNIRVKDKDVVYGDVILLSNIDTSKPFYTPGTNKVSFKFWCDKQVGGVIKIILLINDKSSNYNRSLETTILVGEAGEYTATFNIPFSGFMQSEKLTFNLLSQKALEEYTFYLKPKNDEISNPVDFILQYRNAYDYLHLVKSIDCDKKELRPNDELTVHSSLLFDMKNGVGNIVDLELYAVLSNADGDTYNIGKASDFLINTLEEKDVSLNCKIPEGIAPARYTLFLRAEEMVPYQAESTPPEMLSGANNTIISQIELEITA
ncbi:Streptopain precursor [Cedecea davisae]|uniref:Peptidase C10 family protein n=1 Tax=Cedecea davisae DSM 4568 TaxID=566551 RepID=S3J0B7_9ENTR|nr:C10 family peptidase [Cedecea davisae]EPF18171.1 hypothetical protein HMPREF0201_01582 [Cedecea davisae DSM 4568]SUX28164.1 Streptopain precursor [Cedecea davisae]